jgi:hypothetical protein
MSRQKKQNAPSTQPMSISTGYYEHRLSDRELEWLLTERLWATLKPEYAGSSIYDTVLKNPLAYLRRVTEQRSCHYKDKKTGEWKDGSPYVGSVKGTGRQTHMHVNPIQNDLVGRGKQPTKNQVAGAYCVDVEFDTKPLLEQMLILFTLPCTLAVFSGNKSMHGYLPYIPGIEERWLRNFLKWLGADPDMAQLNRIGRLAGGKRYGNSPLYDSVTQGYWVQDFLEAHIRKLSAFISTHFKKERPEATTAQVLAALDELFTFRTVVSCGKTRDNTLGTLYPTFPPEYLSLFSGSGVSGVTESGVNESGSVESDKVDVFGVIEEQTGLLIAEGMVSVDPDRVQRLKALLLSYFSGSVYSKDRHNHDWAKTSTLFGFLNKCLRHNKKKPDFNGNAVENGGYGWTAEEIAHAIAELIPAIQGCNGYIHGRGACGALFSCSLTALISSGLDYIRISRMFLILKGWRAGYTGKNHRESIDHIIAEAVVMEMCKMSRAVEKIQDEQNKKNKSGKVRNNLIILNTYVKRQQQLRALPLGVYRMEEEANARYSMCFMEGCQQISDVLEYTADITNWLRDDAAALWIDEYCRISEASRMRMSAGLAKRFRELTGRGDAQAIYEDFEEMRPGYVAAHPELTQKGGVGHRVRHWKRDWKPHEEWLADKNAVENRLWEQRAECVEQVFRDCYVGLESSAALDCDFVQTAQRYELLSGLSDMRVVSRMERCGGEVYARYRMFRNTLSSGSVDMEGGLVKQLRAVLAV